jgi:hypothetical protein
MNTSQPLVAKLESGEENFTAETAQKAIEALNGRFDVSISPAEMNIEPRIPWWKLQGDPYEIIGTIGITKQVGDRDLALLIHALERKSTNTGETATHKWPVPIAKGR